MPRLVLMRRSHGTRPPCILGQCAAWWLSSPRLSAGNGGSGAGAKCLAVLFVLACLVAACTSGSHDASSRDTTDSSGASPNAGQGTNTTAAPSTTAAPTTSAIPTTTVPPTTEATPAATQPAQTVPPTTAATTSCYPTTSSGNCYSAGEFCPTKDYNTTGVAGNGEAIKCVDNNGWRWEPA